MALAYLKEYSLFETVEEMDKQIAERIDRDRFELTKSERAIVFAIKQHCLVPVGACHLKNETIAKEVGVSVITVSRAIKKLVEMGIIGKVNRTKMNGIKGANIYYFLPQQNDVSSVMYRENVDGASKIADLNEVLEDGSIKSFNLFSFKQALSSNLYIADATETVCKEIEEPTAYMNEYQQMLYAFMSDLPLVQCVQDDLRKIVLASEIDSVQDFHTAKDVIVNIAKDIADGTLVVNKSIRSVFVGAYKARMERLNSKPSTTISVEGNHDWERPVPLYNWIDERPDDWVSVENNYMPIPNWLDWR